jgi:hypothetical protein
MNLFSVKNSVQAEIYSYVVGLEKKWDGTRISQITQIGTDDKISVGIRQIRAIRVLFQLSIENHNYLSHFEKRYALNQSNSLTDDQ